LYEALGIEPPKMATMPHILGPDGKKKLSKRDDAKDVLDYIRQGYLPEALVSFIATLGWNDGSQQEVFTKDELIQKFNLGRVQKSGAKFDEQRLTWINGYFIRHMDIDELYEKTNGFWPVEAENADENYKKVVLRLVAERLKVFTELPELTRFFFTDLPLDPDLIENNKQLKKLSREELKQLLQTAKDGLSQSSFELDELTERLNKLLEQTGQKPAVLFSLIRIATTQAPASPGLAESLEVLGKETALRRINEQLTAWS
jgi:glutamyl/glutaminyl-tRNA synthetase